MKQFATGAFLGLIVLTAGLSRGATPAPMRMIVVNKHAHALSIYDSANDTKICQADVGVNPHEVAISRDGRTVYVPIYGSSRVGAAGTSEHSLYLIRSTDCRVLGVIDTGRFQRLHGIYVAQNGLIYVTAEVSRAVVIIDPVKRRVIGSIPTGSPFSHMMAVSEAQGRAYVSNVDSDTVSVLDLNNRTLLKQIATAGSNQRMILSPDERWFVTNLGAQHAITLYRTSDLQLEATIPLDGSPFVSRFSPDGKTLYTAGYDARGICIWATNPRSHRVERTLRGLGRSIGSLAISPDGSKLYLSDQNENHIVEISIPAWRTVKVLPTGSGPDEIIFAHVR